MISRLAGPVVCLAMAVPFGAAAQEPVTVEGRVLEEGREVPVATATVELEGHGVAIASGAGTFRFEGVEPGGYVLRVVAFGFVSEARFLLVEESRTVEVRLEAAPVVLDSLVVRPETTDFEGRVRGPEGAYPMVDAEVLTNQGRITTTDTHGRFAFEGVLEDVPLHVSVRAFGFLPVDSAFVLGEDDEPVVELEEDPVVREMIDAQVSRLEERAAPRFAALFGNMNRGEMLRYAGGHTLRSVLEFRYRRWLDRLAGVVIDGESVRGGVLSALSHVLPEEVERIEFWQTGGRSVILRVYTRDFMREMIARDADRRSPGCVETFDDSPPLCW